MNNNNDENYGLPDTLILELPDFPEAGPEAPQYTLLEMIKMSEAMLTYWNRKRFVDGVLYDPPEWDEPFEIEE